MNTLAHYPPSAQDACDPRASHAPRQLDYARLLGADAWRRLPEAVRARFASHDAVWTGTLTLEASRCGLWVVRLLRLIGAPLAPVSAEPVSATVRIEPDPATGGGRWARCYHFPGRTIEARSVKCVEPGGGLVERLGMGLYMRLELRADRDSLHFVSTGYYFEIPVPWPRGGQVHRAHLRLRLPSWWLPGETHVVHRELGHGRFRFTMTIRHKLLGEILRHDGVFRREEADHVHHR